MHYCSYDTMQNPETLRRYLAQLEVLPTATVDPDFDYVDALTVALTIMRKDAIRLQPHYFNDANMGYYSCQLADCGKHRNDPIHLEATT